MQCDLVSIFMSPFPKQHMLACIILPAFTCLLMRNWSLMSRLDVRDSPAGYVLVLQFGMHVSETCPNYTWALMCRCYTCMFGLLSLHYLVHKMLLRLHSPLPIAVFQKEKKGRCRINYVDLRLQIHRFFEPTRCFMPTIFYESNVRTPKLCLQTRPLY